MIIVFAVIGLFVGGMIAEWGGALGGAALGYVIGLHLSFKRRLEILEDELRQRPSPRLFTEDLPAPAFERDWQRPSPAPIATAAMEPPPATEPPPVTEPPPPAPAPRPLFSDFAAPASTTSATSAAEAPPPPPEEPALIAWVRDYFTG